MECKKIVIVFKTHFDIGFTDLAQKVVDGYSSNLTPSVIETCKEAREKNPEYPYVWTMASWPMKTVLESDNTTPRVKREAEELIERGELIWHALPYTTHTEFCGTEEYIRGMYVSKRLCDQYGKHVHSAKMTDVPGHTRALPALLKKSGINFLHLGSNPGSMPPDVPRLFFWEAPDESRVLTFYNKGGYGSSILPPEDWDFPVWLAMMQTNDNVGPHKPEVIAEYIEKAKEVYPDVEIVIGTMDDFYGEITKYPLDTVPVVTEDLADTWIHGVGSYPKEVSNLRNTRQLTDETQKLTTLFAENKEEADCILDKCYEKNLLFGEHTWGLDVKITAGMDRWYEKKEFLEHLSDEHNQRLEASWEEQRVRERESTQMVTALAEEEIQFLAEHVDMEKPHVTVFNGLGFVRDAWVVLPKEIPAETVSLLDKRTETVIPVLTKDGKRVAKVTDIPALGYVSLEVQTEEIADAAEECQKVTFDEENKVLENKFFKLTFDKELGTIRSLVDKRSGKEWVDQESDGLCQYQYDIISSEEITDFLRAYTYRFYDWYVNDFGRMNFSPDQKHVTYRPLKAEVKAEKVDGGMKVSVELDNSEESCRLYGNSKKAVVEVVLYEDEDAIDIKMIVPEKEKTPFVESGHLIFPFAADNAKVTMNKVGQVVDIAKDIRRDANHAIYCCENWMDVAENEDCVTLICKDSPLNAVGESGIYRFNHEYKKSKPVIYNNLFNNMWGTNFPQWIEGSFAYEYRLVFGKQSVEEKNRAAYSFTSPVIAGFGSGREENATIPACDAWLQTDNTIQVLTVKSAETEDGIILRVKDITGEEQTKTITWAKAWKEIWECNCVEVKEGKVAEDADRLEVSFKPYEIKTYLLKA